MDRLHLREGEPRGFSGLGALVSDVDTMLAKDAQLPRGDSLHETVDGGKDFDAVGVARDRGTTPGEADQPGDPWVLFKWALIIALFWIIAAILAPRGSPPPERLPPTGATTSSSESSTPSAPSPSGADPTPVAPRSAASPGDPTRLEEVPPPIGTDHILSTAQLRYCLAESIRINAGDPFTDHEVERFNQFVDDYNRRCGAYRYYPDALERARADIAPHRVRIEEEGRRRLVEGE